MNVLGERNSAIDGVEIEKGDAVLGVDNPGAARRSS
jgi:hypothetical protein